MNYKISFQERAALAMMLLYKQLPITLEQAKKQAKHLKTNSKSKNKKKKVS